MSSPMSPTDTVSLPACREANDRGPADETGMRAIGDGDSAGSDGWMRNDSLGAACPAAEAMPSDRIWIGQEELALTRQAIVDQLLPLTQIWADAQTDATAEAGYGTIVDELIYQCQLLINVMELLGIQILAEGMSVVRNGLEARAEAVTPEFVALWCSGLLAVIEQPGRETADLLTTIGRDLSGLGTEWSEGLADELTRVVVGQDPSLLLDRKSVAEFEDASLSVADDVVPSVLDGMLRELPGNVSRLGAAVRTFAETGSPEPIDEARRIAHTLKGDANTVGVRGLATLTHALEDILIELAKRPDKLTADCADMLTAASDCIEEIADYLLGRGPAPDNVLDVYQRVLDTANAFADGTEAPAAGATAAPGADTATTDTVGALVAPRQNTETAGVHSLNVPSSLLDELQRLAGETMVTAHQIEQRLDALGGLHRDQRQRERYSHELMGRLDDLVALRGAALQSTAQKAGAELDPLEIDQYNELHVISRQLLEAHADSGEFMRSIERLMTALTDLRSEQTQLNRDLQRIIQRTRTVPFGHVSARLQRIVRQTAKQLMKPIQLDLIGEDIPLDAELLERIVEPLAHLLRNAIDHGIESLEERRAAAKPDTGYISLRVGLQGDSALIELQDDGRGLDLDAIRAQAVAAGLLSADQFADDRQLTRMILLPGFSTRSAASEVSGRGIGMDVVNKRVAALRGAMTIASGHGRGMRVQLRLPVTQTLANVIVARGLRQVNAVVSSSVERVISFAPGECYYDDGSMRILSGNERIAALPIETLYGEQVGASAWLNDSGIGLLVRNADGKSSIVLVRSIVEVRSVVVKPISPLLPPIPAVRGISQLGDGSLAPVIDLDILLHSTQEHAFDMDMLTLTETAAAARVVIADDSLSVRRALEQLMQDAGFEVATARDGFEALTEVQAKPTHALLVDLEMPRMNGLEVTRNLRNHTDTRDLPVVMITSRATDKHQAMAGEAGVTRMLGKPFSEDSLVALVRELVAERMAGRSLAQTGAPGAMLTASA